jgi:hypothetical protein
MHYNWFLTTVKYLKRNDTIFSCLFFPAFLKATSTASSHDAVGSFPFFEFKRKKQNVMLIA